MKRIATLLLTILITTAAFALTEQQKVDNYNAWQKTDMTTPQPEYPDEYVVIDNKMQVMTPFYKALANEYVKGAKYNDEGTVIINGTLHGVKLDDSAFVMTLGDIIKNGGHVLSIITKDNVVNIITQK
jgi:hypothetical protein